MIAEHGTYGRLGPTVVFELDGQAGVLWRSTMAYVPRPDDLVGQVEDGETDVLIWYKVESVRYEFVHDVAGDYAGPGGGAVSYTDPEDEYGVCVYVSVVV